MTSKPETVWDDLRSEWEMIGANEKWTRAMRERRFTDSQKSLNAVRVMYRASQWGPTDVHR